jgi:hypothetical protein
VLLCGRRAGKDRFLSAVAVWRAALCANWVDLISPGEQAVCLLLGADKKQAAILRRYCEGLLRAPLLAAEVVRQTDAVIEFRNGASLEISANDARLVRGRSAIAVLGSEASHWKTDEYAASSDEEVVGAAEPSLSMCPDGGLLLLGSSVHRKRGFMYRKYRQCQQLAGLERRVHAGARESVSHAQTQSAHDDLAASAAGAIVLAALRPAYNLFAPGLFDDEPQEPTWAERERQRHYDELLQRYGQPVSLNPLPREYVEQAKAGDLLPEHVREGLARARLDALRRRNGGST